MPTSPTVKKQIKMHANVPLKYKHKSIKPAEKASATFGFKWLSITGVFSRAWGIACGTSSLRSKFDEFIYTFMHTHTFVILHNWVERIFRSNFSDCHREKKKNQQTTNNNPLMRNCIFSKFLQKHLIQPKPGQAGTAESLSAGHMEIMLATGHNAL